MKKNKIFGSYNRLVLLIGLVALLVSSCKSNRTVTSTSQASSNRAHEQLLEDILKAETPYKTISGKISVEFMAGDKNSGMKANSQLKIVKNDVIQLSIRAPFINTELFRLDITPDSIFIVDRVSKRYASESFNQLDKEKKVKFNYTNLQALFTNVLFLPGKADVNKSDYKQYDFSYNSGEYNLTTDNRSDAICNFTIDANDRVKMARIYGAEGNYSLDWLYSDFDSKKETNTSFPTKMLAKISIDKVKASIAIDCPKLEFDKNIDVNRKLPSNYKQVSIKEIIKSYIGT